MDLAEQVEGGWTWRDLVIASLYTRELVKGTKCNLTLLGSGHITCMKHTNCRVYSR
jgi:hypothetical protein